MNAACFLIEPTGRARLFLRRFRMGDDKKCPGSYGYHNARQAVGEAAQKLTAEGHIAEILPEVYADDPRWPVKCAACDYEFSVTDDDDHWQVFQDQVYRRTDTGAEGAFQDDWQKTPGAMWNAGWMHHKHPEDGKYLIVVLPDLHQWAMDGRCSNCDSPCVRCGQPYHAHGAKSACRQYSDARPHQCWIRHGVPPQLTVGKDGPTCSAGAGSIMTPNWHGFLRNGILEQC
jgi:hypothetical protein